MENGEFVQALQICVYSGALLQRTVYEIKELPAIQLMSTKI